MMANARAGHLRSARHERLLQLRLLSEPVNLEAPDALWTSEEQCEERWQENKDLWAEVVGLREIIRKLEIIRNLEEVNAVVGLGDEDGTWRLPPQRHQRAAE